MRIILHRTEFFEKSTLGHLFVDDGFECWTLEDAVRPMGPDGSGKVFGATAISSGTYKVTIDFSQKFQKNMIHILDVPWFTGIRIHSGNTDLNTEGCVLVGQERLGDDYIHGGSIALPILQSKIQGALDKGESVDITITGERP
jgi:hypothetical protein